MSHERTAVSAIIAAFGGQNALARQLGRRQSVVWGWAKNGRVPSKRIPEIIAAGLSLNPPVQLTPSDFFDLRGVEVPQQP
ncbi:carph-isopro domain-containing protein [Roseomonas sp. BN140053]|uniref:carph-isopro domain-containing protein n=1 Tax=Roseomonas sp. BN140053 TaxID=3391898 RepID=UPI0039EA4F71